MLQKLSFHDSVQYTCERKYFAFCLTHLFPMYPFATSKNIRKPNGFLLSGDRERMH